MCKTISPFFYYSELKDMNALKVLSDTNKCFYLLFYLNSNRLRLLARGLSLLVIFFLLSL